MIPVCEPFLTGKELDYVADCLKTNWISSMGKYIGQFETQFASYCGCKHGISVTNGTAALHLALASLGIGPGDEVILPAFTMAASVFSIIYTGAKPVLVDSEPDTWNMAVSGIEERINDRTRAIMPVHIYGHPCDMDPIIEIAGRRGLLVVEDAAEAHGACYRGRKAGALGDVGCFSFYANKIITTGEGGMLVTNDDAVAEKARRLKDQAYSPARRFLHTDLGFNYRMTNIQAAIGLAQLENIDSFVDLRRRHASAYNAALNELPGITLPPEKEWARSVYWMYSILIGHDFPVGRDELMTRLKEKGVDTRAFFIPMHMQPAFATMGLFKGESHPVAEELSRRGLYLPSGSGLKEEDLDYVCRSMREISASS